MSENNTQTQDVEPTAVSNSPQDQAEASTGNTGTTQASADSSTAQNDAAGQPSGETTGQSNQKPSGGSIPMPRFHEMVANKNKFKDRAVKAEAENKILREQQHASNQPETNTQTPQTTQNNARPTLEQFEYDEAAHRVAEDAYVQQQINTQVEAGFKARDEATAQAKQQDELNQIKDSWNDKESAYAAENPEYQQLIIETGDPGYSPAVEQALLTSDNGPALEHHLLANPEIRNKLSAMTGFQAAVEMGKLEASLTGRSSQGSQKPVSKAPPPIETVGGGGGSTTVDVRYDPNISMEEFDKAATAARGA